MSKIRHGSKTGKYISDLTFDEKRILTLCCALCGDTKIVLMDDPTLKLTYYNQLLFWDILRQEKYHRSIILLTSSTDEAHTTADRIALFCSGVLKAYGSVFFLKVKYGHGYELVS